MYVNPNKHALTSHLVLNICGWIGLQGAFGYLAEQSCTIIRTVTDVLPQNALFLDLTFFTIQVTLPEQSVLVGLTAHSVWDKARNNLFTTRNRSYQWVLTRSAANTLLIDDIEVFPIITPPFLCDWNASGQRHTCEGYDERWVEHSSNFFSP